MIESRWKREIGVIYRSTVRVRYHSTVQLHTEKQTAKTSHPVESVARYPGASQVQQICRVFGECSVSVEKG